jgi:transcriptional regulator with XRE-family HTH domain
MVLADSDCAGHNRTGSIQQDRIAGELSPPAGCGVSHNRLHHLAFCAVSRSSHYGHPSIELGYRQLCKIIFPLENSCLWKTLDSLRYNSLVPSARDPESVYRFFGRRLRDLREERRVPQQELATLSGLTRGSIANIESGRQRVLLHQLLHFAEALGVEVSDLVPKISQATEASDSANRTLMEDYLRRLRLTVGARIEERRQE